MLTLDFQELKSRRRCLLRGAFVKLRAGRISLRCASGDPRFRGYAQCRYSWNFYKQDSIRGMVLRRNQHLTPMILRTSSPISSIPKGRMPNLTTQTHSLILSSRWTAPRSQLQALPIAPSAPEPALPSQPPDQSEYSQADLHPSSSPPSSWGTPKLP